MVADLVVLDADRDHHGVVVPVVGAEDLHHVVTAGVTPGDPDRVHGRFRAGIRVAPLRQAPAGSEIVADRDRVLGRCREMGALLVALLDGLADQRVRVALDHRAEAVVEVPHLVAVDVPDLRSVAALHVDRPRLAQLVGGGHTAREVMTGPLEGLFRLLRIGVEALLFAQREFLDPGPVETGGGAGGHSGVPLVFVACGGPASLTGAEIFHLRYRLEGPETASCRRTARHDN